MDGAQPGLKAKDAIDAGFALFKEFFPKTQVKRVLLEGLEFLGEDGQWLIKIGFDAGGMKETRNPLGFGPATTEPIREVREFYINANDGSLVRMN